jgi:hypothetical protein
VISLGGTARRPPNCRSSVPPAPGRRLAGYTLIEREHLARAARHAKVGRVAVVARILVDQRDAAGPRPVGAQVLGHKDLRWSDDPASAAECWRDRPTATAHPQPKRSSGVRPGRWAGSSRPSTATWIGGPVEGGDGISGRVHNLGTASRLLCLDRGLHPNRPFGSGPWAVDRDRRGAGVGSTTLEAQLRLENPVWRATAAWHARITGKCRPIVSARRPSCSG